MGSLYRDVVDVTAVYLGPAADRFVSRQVVGHLNKSPEKLKSSDLKALLKWIKPAMAILTDDTNSVDTYIARLKDLTYKAEKANKNV